MAKRIIIFIGVFFILIGCSSSYQVEEMSVGVAAEKGPILMVGEVTFDETWSVPAGAIGCCWKDSGALSFVYDTPFPNTVVIAWYDLSTELFWVGEAQIDNKTGYEFIQKMKPVIVRSTGEYFDDSTPYLIVGIKRNGLIKVWISNSSSEAIGRQILEIGSGMAQIKELPPEDER
ncbi:DUF2931 domain-containing protein [Pseudoalteromonas umbrosa]|uniref:DUF2931 domain-containing protein n=1 Tax=Pseudoalteromonas umbrosa TaxID=3048489 RepID=UPI0024C27697|nr:DUF2931 domain-containing protein [Pseudoalteromonas sp. B95]MDK1287609.1 DUF2931 domain-containing protein [Pseudoalteromonas sp. B95]